MARYIDADELIKKIFPYDVVDKKRYAINAEVVYKAIQIVTAADVVEVVRCMDCVYWDGRGYDGRCEAPKNGLIRDYTNYDDFCSCGERKEK